MPDLTQFALYLLAALLLAVTPGPGIFYAAARTLAGGRAEGIASRLAPNRRRKVRLKYEIATAVPSRVETIAGAIKLGVCAAAS